MTDRKRILFVNDEMQMGGVARVLNTLMEALPKDQYEIDLLVLHKRGMLMKEVPEEVHVMTGTAFFETVDQSLASLIHWKDRAMLFSKIRLLFYMKTGMIKNRIRKERKKLIQKPYDIEVAAKEGFCTIFTAAGDSRRKINWVLTDYSVCNYSRWHMPIMKWALQYIDLNIADSEQALKAYEQVFQISNGISIHNLMDVERVQKGCLDESSIVQEPGVLNVICVARFHPQKSIGRLIQASQKAYNAGLKHRLYLIGGGEEEDSIRSYVSENHMNYVVFLGYKQNPYADMAAADLFVLPSLYEGFATVINESLIAGTPVLSTEVSGVSEQITKPEYGWIVENSQEGLDSGLAKALSSPEKLHEMKEGLRTYTYPNDLILQKFMDAFSDPEKG